MQKIYNPKKPYAKSVRFIGLAFVLVALGILSIFLGVFLGAHIHRQYRMKPPVSLQKRDVQSIQSWMTLGYISRAYGVPLNELDERLQLQGSNYTKKNLSQIAKLIQQDELDFISLVRSVVADFQKAHVTPPPR